MLASFGGIFLCLAPQQPVLFAALGLPTVSGFPCEVKVHFSPWVSNIHLYSEDRQQCLPCRMLEVVVKGKMCALPTLPPVSKGHHSYPCLFGKDWMWNSTSMHRTLNSGDQNLQQPVSHYQCMHAFQGHGIRNSSEISPSQSPKYYLTYIFPSPVVLSLYAYQGLYSL
jgi:hypothetical protein